MSSCKQLNCSDKQKTATVSNFVQNRDVVILIDVSEPLNGFDFVKIMVESGRKSFFDFCFSVLNVSSCEGV